MHDQQQPHPMGRLGSASFWFILVLQTMSVSMEVFLRKGMGSRALGLRAGLALLLIPLWLLLWPHDNGVPLLGFWACYLVAYLAQNAAASRRFRRGEATHSRYTGYPRLMRFFPRADESKFKASVEPLIVFLTGALLTGWNAPLATYLMFASFALAGTSAVIDAAMKARVRDLNDARIDQEDLAERLRKLRGE